jgi:CRISPR-associated endonuclease Csn1
MKKILGLDLGVASIGWALIHEDNSIPKEILGIGSRIVPLSTNDANEFSSGNAI